MRTLVIQSFRDHDVPEWLEKCMNSVQEWSRQIGFSYKKLGDEFFQLAPQWYRNKAGSLITVITDLTRLIAMQENLRQGYDRCIWVDADVLIFERFGFQIADELSFAFSREVIVARDENGRLTHFDRVNNSVCCFTQNSIDILTELIAECLAVVHQKKALGFADAGTELLTLKSQTHQLPVLKNTGLLNPLMLIAICEKDRQALHFYMQKCGEPIFAANLCHSFSEKGIHHKKIADRVFAKAIEELQTTKGKILNVELETLPHRTFKKETYLPY
jgi:hypothetical protein